MLVLTRKSNQSIMIGDDIEVSVLSIMGEKVRIGIQAPRDIPVFRREVYLEILLALERLDLLNGHVELVCDPGVGAALSHPPSDLVKLRTQGPATHERPVG